MASFRMPEEWAEHHARNARTDSRTLPPAAFPSLPIDQPPQAVPTQPLNDNADDDDVTDSDVEEKENRPTSTDSDKPNVISEVSWKAINYHIGQYTPAGGLLDEAVITERQRLVDAGLLSTATNRLQRRSCPRSVNYGFLREKYDELTNKRETLKTRLRMLGYQGRRLQTTSLPARPTSIDALWHAVQDLRWLTHRLELVENHAHHIAKAKRRFLAPPKPKKLRTPHVTRPDAHALCLPICGGRNDPGWLAMQATARTSRIARAALHRRSNIVMRGAPPHPQQAGLTGIQSYSIVDAPVFGGSLISSMAAIAHGDVEPDVPSNLVGLDEESERAWRQRCLCRS
ncbi:hypothetical protein C7974DRAFT_376377 [Boeremia exigua]|uniref:uncharacterized protein n=1 Tax=Boeremia exigua TaxID=749465 RepID=UPI001E8E23FE|nr:uncharacterized protein C7974DRAFT_376377 [Boeremia exigua]KAH6629550.1 hypothetical protein C7974DRAFT_376377 [Boeremia exigua]